MKKLLVSLFVLCLLICGCSPKEVKASAAVETYFTEHKNQIKEGDFESLGLGELTADGEDGFDEEVLKKLITSIGDYDCKVNSETEDGDTATVNVTISTYDFSAWFSNSLSAAIGEVITLSLSGNDSDEAMTEIMNKVFNEQTDAIISAGKTKTTTLDIICKKDNGQWVVDEEATGEELYDALTGGLLSSLTEMASGLEDLLG